MIPWTASMRIYHGILRLTVYAWATEVYLHDEMEVHEVENRVTRSIICPLQFTSWYI